MHSRSMQFLAVLFAVMLLLQPVAIASGRTAGADGTPETTAAQPCVDDGEPRSAPADPDLSRQRAIVVGQLIEMGYDEPAAREAAAQLTAEDLEVLTANPAMMQRAGDMDRITQAYIIIGLIVAGVIVLAAFSDGAFLVTN